MRKIPSFLNERVLARFWRKVARASSDECWRWLAEKTPKGYGRFTIDGSSLIASRVAWSIANGPIPDDLCVLHRCDNPTCVNPSHLFLGTISDNNRDAIGKGRMFSVEWRSKMSALRRGRRFSESHKMAIARALKGKVASEDSRRLMSLAARARANTPEGRRHLLEILKLRKAQCRP